MKIGGSDCEISLSYTDAYHTKSAQDWGCMYPFTILLICLLSVKIKCLTWYIIISAKK